MSVEFFEYFYNNNHGGNFNLVSEEGRIQLNPKKERRYQNSYETVSEVIFVSMTDALSKINTYLKENNGKIISITELYDGYSSKHVCTRFYISRH